MLLNRLTALQFFLLCVFSCAVLAQPKWDDEPLPAKFDWVKLTSGEWLKGELKVLYDSELEFDSDNLGLLHLDWDDVAEIRSAQVLSVRFNNGSQGIGKVLMRDGQVSFNGVDVESYDAKGIMSMAAGGTQGSSYWSAEVVLGGNFKRGNSLENIFDSHIDIKRRTNASQFKFNYLATLRRVDNIETENSHRISSSYDVFITQKLFWRPVYGEYYRDKIQNISDRVTVGMGVGYHLIDSSKTTWGVTAGPGYQYSRFVSVSEGENNPEGSGLFMFETLWDYELSKVIDIKALYNIQLTNDESGRYKHHSRIGMEYELTDALDFNIYFIWDRTEKPQRDEAGVLPEQDDTRMTVGLGYEF
tara:strand:+ start:5475 stop:6551 length:1077 start_codon:yes stop_codon:yes gene_type:complete